VTEQTTIPGAYVVDVTKANFEATVQLSAKVPVIAVFTSPRSSVSGELLADVRAVVESLAGRVQLAVIDADADPEVAAAFQVQAVPSTVALVQGQPFPLFQGKPLPDAIRSAIDQVLMAAGQMGITGVLEGNADDGGDAEPEIPPLHREALELLEAGDLEGAKGNYRLAIKDNPADSEAKIAITQIELLERAGEMDPREVLDQAKDAPLTDVETQLRAADVEMGMTRPDAAFARLLDAIKATSGDDREKLRARLVEFFAIVGIHDPLVTQARKALASALM